jgi:exopolyphosphatase/guanosine-5'-triphosphate,3'-diphosphate pyrophosphatase
MRKNEVEVAAAIDIGLNYIRIIIAQIAPNGEYFVLEELERPNYIKMDIIISNKVSIDSIRNMCSILENYAKLMKQYRVKTYKAVSSAIRSASNREYVLEQIKLFTGIDVTIINIGEERFFLYKALNRNIINSGKAYKDGNMILNINLEGFGVSIYKEGTLSIIEYIKVDALQLHEIFFEIVSKSLDSFHLIEDYINSKIYYLMKRIGKIKVNNLIVLGEEIPLIAQICHMDKKFQHAKSISPSELELICLRLRSMSGKELSAELNIKGNNPILLVSSLILLNCFVKITEVDKINVSFPSIKYGLLEDIVDEYYNTRRKNAFIMDILNSVKYSVKKYAFEIENFEYRRNISLSIFDQTTKIHKLGERERLYLQIASLLNDIGEVMNIGDDHKYFLNIINSEHLLGLSNREIRIVTSIAVHEKSEVSDTNREGNLLLTTEDNLIVSKLAGILKIVAALDISNKNKIDELKITQSGRNLLFYAKVKDEFLLEQWSFKYNSILFKEVMGYDCILIQRKN